MRQGRGLKPGCPVGPERLVRLRFLHRLPGGGSAEGELVFHRALAPELDDIFGEIYRAGFPLRQARPAEAFAGDDGQSMAAHNSSAFNCRARTPSAAPGLPPPAPTYSVHSYGAALDLNPAENSYFRPAASPGQALPGLLEAFCCEAKERCDVLPEAGRAALDRRQASKGQGALRAGGAVVRAFKARGWRWGGDWPAGPDDRVRTDTQHFEKDPPRQ